MPVVVNIDKHGANKSGIKIYTKRLESTLNIEAAHILTI